MNCKVDRNDDTDTINTSRLCKLIFYDEMKNNPIFLSPGLALLFPWSLLIIVVPTCLTITTVDKVQSTQQMSFFLTQVAVNKISCWQKYFMQTWHWYKSLFNFEKESSPKKYHHLSGFFFVKIIIIIIITCHDRRISSHYHYHGMSFQLLSLNISPACLRN